MLLLSHFVAESYEQAVLPRPTYELSAVPVRRILSIFVVPIRICFPKTNRFWKTKYWVSGFSRAFLKSLQPAKERGGGERSEFENKNYRPPNTNFYSSGVRRRDAQTREPRYGAERSQTNGGWLRTSDAIFVPAEKY